MDYHEEQQQEIEILQSIYPDELFVESETEFYINLLLDTPSEKKHRLKLNIKYPDTYPEVIPEIRVEVGELMEIDEATYHPGEESEDDEEDAYNEDESHKMVMISETIEFDDEDLSNLTKSLVEIAEEQVGIPSIFAIASTLKDQAESLFEEKLNVKQKQYDEELLAKEREEQKKFYGTKVTPESFNEWRLKFRKELKIDEKLAIRQKQYHNGKLTGKEIFERGLAGDDDIIEDLDKLAITA